MPINVGSALAPQLYVGSTQVRQVFVGSTQVYAAEPEFVGRLVTSASGDATPTVNLSGTLTGGIRTSPAAGDCVLVFMCRNAGSDLNYGMVTSGYTELYDSYNSGIYPAQLGVFYKVLSSAEASVELDLGGSTLEHRVIVYVFSNISSASPINVAGSARLVENAAVIDPNAITTTVDGAIVIAAGSKSASGGIGTITAPSGFTGLAVSGNAFDALAVAHQIQPTAGSINPGPFGGSIGGTNFNSINVAFALTPA